MGKNYNDLIYQTIKRIMTALFIKEVGRLQKEIDRLFEKNNQAYDDTLDAFLFQGETFRPENYARGGAKRRGLHPSLWPEAELFLKDRKIIEEDKASISQVLYLLLQPAEDIQEIHDTLPSCLDDITVGMGVKNRIFPEAYTIRDDPRAQRAYDKVLPKIITYATARLIY